MQNLSKLKLFFIAVLYLFAAILLPFTPIFSKDTNASFWSGNLPNCYTSGVVAKAPPLPPALAADVVRGQYPSGWIGSLDWDNPLLSGVFGMTTLSGESRMFFEWNGSATTSLSSKIIRFNGNGAGANYTEQYPSGSGGASFVILNDDGTYITGSPGNVGSFAPTCIAETRNVEYMPDYVGDEYEPISDILLFAHVRYNISDNVLTVNYIGPTCIQDRDDDNKCIPPKIGYHLQTDGGGETILFSVLNTTETFTYTFNQYEHYELTVQMLDYDQIPYENLPSGYIYGYTVVSMYVNGTNNYLHDSLGCYIADEIFCLVDEYSPFIDCSAIFGDFDLVGGFGCVMENFGIFLKASLFTLFTPNPDFYKNYWAEFGEFLNTKLGMLYTSIGFVFSLFGSIITSGATTECTITPVGTLFGQSFTIDVCSFEDIAGSTLWGVLQGLVISLTILALSFALYRKYNEVVDKR